MIIEMNNEKKINSLPDTSEEDIKLKNYLLKCLPKDVDTDKIKLSTFHKIKRERQESRMHKAFVALLAVAASVCFFIFLPREQTVAIDAVKTNVVAKQVPVYHVVTVPTAQIKKVVLPDGTRVMLNSRSQLRYPEKFDSRTREVYLQGEAYLEVAHNKEKPFIVHANNFNIQVLGTKFNVNSYNGKSAFVALVDGSVQVTTAKNQNKVMMNPNNLLRLKDGNIDELVHTQATDYISWLDKKLKLNGDKMDRIMTNLANYYDLEIVYNKPIPKIELYGKLELKAEPQKVLEAISQLSGLSITMKNKKIYITY
jgi:transmembrane sensor